MFRLDPASQFVEQYHGIACCALNMKNLISFTPTTVSEGCGVKNM
jgi:hypothetical protein